MNLDEATLQSFKWLLIKHESIEMKPYFDCCGKFFRDCKCKKQGKLTIGIGRNLEDVGLSEPEILLLNENDIMRVSMEADKAFPWFGDLNGPRKIVIMSMVFNIGINGLKEFKNMVNAMTKKNYEKAANEMLNSLWASQVKKRAVALSEIMKTGEL